MRTIYLHISISQSHALTQKVYCITQLFRHFYCFSQQHGNLQVIHGSQRGRSKTLGLEKKMTILEKRRGLCYTQQNQKTHTSNTLVAKHIRHTRYNHKFFFWVSECIKYCCSTSHRKEVTCRGEEVPRTVVAYNTSHKLS